MNPSVSSVRSSASVCLLVLAAGCSGRVIQKGSPSVDVGNAGMSNAGSADPGKLGSGDRGSGGNVSGSSGSSGQGPRFACSAVPSQQFDPAFMQSYSESPDVTQAVQAT